MSETPEKLQIPSYERAESKTTFDEIQKKLEALVQQDGIEMELGMQNLESEGKRNLGNANIEIRVSDEDVSEVQEFSSVQEKLAAIAETAHSLFEKSKKAMKSAVALGMVTMTVSGCAGNFDDESTFVITDEDMLELQKTETPYGEKARERMLEMIASKTYLERLTQETSGDIEEAKRIQHERYQNVQDVGIEYVESVQTLNTVFAVIASTGSSNTEGGKVAAFTYFPEDTTSPVKIAVTEEKIGNNIDHELSHASNINGLNIPQETAERLKKLFIAKTDYDSYFKIPTEVLARKQAIDAKLEELGIKKYEEQFTQKHFQMLLRVELLSAGVDPESPEDINVYIEKCLQEKKQLPAGIEFFFLYDTENIEKLFNEVADTGKGIEDLQSKKTIG